MALTMKRTLRGWLGPNDEERENAARRPAGSVTFLDADMSGEGYDELKPDHTGEGVASMAARFAQRVAEAVKAQGGVVASAVGDSVLGVFTEPAAAVIAAVEAHRAILREGWPGGRQVRGRYALYTGEAEVAERFRQYRGDALGYAVRLKSASPPDRIRIGERTAREARDHLPPDVTLLDDGMANIDRFPADRVYTILIADLGSE